MKCPNCGKEIENDSIFCEYCGANVANQYDNALLTILDNAMADEEPMQALMARKKCHNICKNKYPHDYKEYVKHLMVDKYSELIKRCYLDEQYFKRNIGLIFGIIILIFSFVIGIGGLSSMDHPDFRFGCDYFNFFIVTIASSIIIIILLKLVLTRKKWYKNKLKEIQTTK